MTTDFLPSPELRADLDRTFTVALAVGIAFFIASIIGAFFSPGDFFRSYLMSFLFWWNVTLGAMAVVMMQHLTAGAWGVVTRRALECASRTLPLIVVLFIPIACATPELYDWAHPNLVHAEYALRHRAAYMNTPFFIGRAAFYFIVWGIFTYFLNKWSTEQDETGGLANRLNKLSAPGLVLYVFTVTFSSIDWAESLETNFYSTIWGFLFVARQGLTAFAFAIIVMALLSRRAPLRGLIRPVHFHDLGKLLLTFVMIWAYFAFSQLVIIWSGNLTDEIPWYLLRFATTWGALGIALILLEFIVPFLMLLSRPLKRSAIGLCCVVGIIIIMRWVDLAWIVFPEYYRKGFRVQWLDFCVPVGMTGIWIAAFVWHLRNRPLLPLKAPNLEKALIHEEPE